MFNFNRFDALCKERGMKKSGLYERVGMRKDSSSNLKRTQSVNPEYVKIWADALNTTPEYLNGLTDVKEKTVPTKENSLFESIDNLEAVLTERLKECSTEEVVLLKQKFRRLNDKIDDVILDRLQNK